MSVNFTGSAKILYKSPQAFEELVKSVNAREVGVFPNYSISNKVTASSPKYSQYANTCSILDVNDTMVHLAPEMRGRNFIQKLTDLVKKEKDERGDLTAMVIGGKVNRPESEGLFYEIGNLLDKEGADFSMIGLKNANSSKGLDSVCKNGDTFVFTQEYNPALEKVIKENKSLTPAGLKKVFERFYDYIEISPKHEIIK